MVGVYKNDLEVLVHAILVDPIRVEHAEITATAPNTLLRRGPQTALIFEVVDTLPDGLAIGST
jgi:hypothetical protein